MDLEFRRPFLEAALRVRTELRGHRPPAPHAALRGPSQRSAAALSTLSGGRCARLRGGAPVRLGERSGRAGRAKCGGGSAIPRPPPSTSQPTRRAGRGHCRFARREGRRTRREALSACPSRNARANRKSAAPMRRSQAPSFSHTGGGARLRDDSEGARVPATLRWEGRTSRSRDRSMVAQSRPAPRGKTWPRTRAPKARRKTAFNAGSGGKDRADRATPSRSSGEASWRSPLASPADPERKQRLAGFPASTQELEGVPRPSSRVDPLVSGRTDSPGRREH